MKKTIRILSGDGDPHDGGQTNELLRDKFIVWVGDLVEKLSCIESRVLIAGRALSIIEVNGIKGLEGDILCSSTTSATFSNSFHL